MVQSELGDFEAAEHGHTYLAGFKMAPNQTPELEEKVAQLHKTLRCAPGGPVSGINAATSALVQSVSNWGSPPWNAVWQCHSDCITYCV